MTEPAQHCTENNRPSSKTRDNYYHDGLKMTCCGCIDIRRGVILSLWVQFFFVFLATILLLIAAIVLSFLVADEESRRSAGLKGDEGEMRRSLWMYFGIYLAVTLFTCFGLVAVKYRKLHAYKIFNAVNVTIFLLEIVVSIVMQTFQVYAIIGLVLRAYWVWVFYRYIATLAMEIEHIGRQKEAEFETFG